MELLINICCICWESKNNLNKLNTLLDVKTSLYQKLITTVKEMEFEEMNETYMICQQCISELDIVYNFRIKCLIAKTAITDYMIKFHENNIFKGENFDVDKIKVKSVTNSDNMCNFEESIIIKQDSCQASLTDTNTSYQMTENDTCKINISDLNKKVINCKNGLDIYPINIGYKNMSPSNKEDKVINLIEKHINCNNNETTTEESKFDFVDVNVTIEENTDSNGQLRCADCDLTFAQYTDFIMHMHQHSSKKPFECHICLKRFSKEHHFQNHLKTHPDDLNFNCERCDLDFKNEKLLKLHLKQHKEELPTSFICDICGKILSRLSHLKDHRLSHFKTSEYPCEVCGKIFHYKRGLRKHLPIHSGEKPFKCNLCNRSFNRKDNLGSHQRVHCKKLQNRYY